MIDRAKQFEIGILRPLQIVFLASCVFFVIKGMCLWLFGCVLGVIYLGIIGSKLHPLQSATDLSKGPLESLGAQLESELLNFEIRRVIVGHACTRVGILLGISTGALFWGFLGLRWYFSILIALVVTGIIGGLLKFLFKTVTEPEVL
jgi:hypothetical protein